MFDADDPQTSAWLDSVVTRYMTENPDANPEQVVAKLKDIFSGAAQAQAQPVAPTNAVPASGFKAFKMAVTGNKYKGLIMATTHNHGWREKAEKFTVVRANFRVINEQQAHLIPQVVQAVEDLMPGLTKGTAAALIKNLTGGVMALPSKPTLEHLQAAIEFYWIASLNGDQTPSDIANDGTVTWKSKNGKDIYTDAPGVFQLLCGCFLSAETASRRAQNAHPGVTVKCPCDTKFAAYMGKTLAAVAPEDYNAPIAFMAGGNCVMCMEPMGANKRMICLNRHFACVSCITTWLEMNSSCPVCRTKDVIDPKKQEQPLPPVPPVEELENRQAYFSELSDSGVMSDDDARDAFSNYLHGFGIDTDLYMRMLEGRPIWLNDKCTQCGQFITMSDIDNLVMREEDWSENHSAEEMPVMCESCCFGDQGQEDRQQEPAAVEEESAAVVEEEAEESVDADGSDAE